MKLIVTHRSVDLDNLTSCWLIKRFLPDWLDAEIEFVDAGTTKDNKDPDADSSIIHVDTGYGKFDHHQVNDDSSASERVFNYLCVNGKIEQKYEKAVERMVNLVTKIDHFQEVYFPEAAADYYDLMLHQIIEGLKGVLGKDEKIMVIGYTLLDSVFQIFKNKVKAEEAIKKGYVFNSIFGKSIMLESQNEEAVKLALKSGYVLVARKNPVQGHIRIKTLPGKKYDLTPIYEEIKKIDKKGTWFFHVSRNMLLNSSSKNPNFVPSPITSKKLIEILRRI